MMKTKTIMWVFFAGYLLALIGCTHNQPIMYSDGQPAYMLKCKGDIEKCMEIAGQTCPSGYKRLDNTDDKAYQGFGPFKKQHHWVYRCS